MSTYIGAVVCTLSGFIVGVMVTGYLAWLWFGDDETEDIGEE